MCLPNEDGTAGQAIGVIDLEKREMGGPQNRCCGFGIVINKQYSVSLEFPSRQSHTPC